MEQVKIFLTFSKPPTHSLPLPPPPPQNNPIQQQKKDNNGITGTIPSQFGNLVNLTVLNLGRYQ